MPESLEKKRTKILLRGDGCHNCRFAEQVRIFDTDNYDPDKLACTNTNSTLPKYVSKSTGWCTKWEALEVDPATKEAYERFRKELRDKYGR
jgi:hypothetical protein